METPADQPEDYVENINKSLTLSGMIPTEIDSISWSENTPLAVHLYDKKEHVSGYLAAPLSKGGPLRLKRNADSNTEDGAVTILANAEFAFTHANGEVIISDSNGEHFICAIIEADEVDGSTLDTISEPSDTNETLEILEMKAIDLFSQNESIFTQLVRAAAAEAETLLSRYQVGELPGNVEHLLSPILEWATRPREDTLNNPLPNAILNSYKLDDPPLTLTQSHNLKVITATRIYKRDGRKVLKELEESKRRNVRQHSGSTRSLTGTILGWFGY